MDPKKFETTLSGSKVLFKTRSFFSILTSLDFSLYFFFVSYHLFFDLIFNFFDFDCFYFRYVIIYILFKNNPMGENSAVRLNLKIILRHIFHLTSNSEHFLENINAISAFLLIFSITTFPMGSCSDVSICLILYFLKSSLKTSAINCL